jgi:hypothetical protein
MVSKGKKIKKYLDRPFHTPLPAFSSLKFNDLFPALSLAPVRVGASIMEVCKGAVDGPTTELYPTLEPIKKSIR